ncbi:MAG: MaoC/PaaZ C-terminal domain-containing protein [Porticoccaceae bacterium]|nr:MaoC/PaaZ C-terminal domain-containing protein [Porticoccaceae bacterium]
MAIVYDELKNRKFEEIVHTYTERDTMLYALGAGVGYDPMDEKALNYVYEENLSALPTMATVLAYPGFWLKEPDTGVDWTKVLHADQEIILHKPLPPSGTVKATTKVDEIIDKGEGKGVFIYSSRTVSTEDGEPLCTLIQNTMARGQGGFGGCTDRPPASQTIPETAPDSGCELPTLPQAALIYRLSGDYNPLHADPAVAKQGGFERPILHGLCTFGVAGHALLKTCCDYDVKLFRSMKARFSAPVYPGETIRTDIWKLDTGVAFRCTVVERDLVVIDNGFADVG